MAKHAVDNWWEEDKSDSEADSVPQERAGEERLPRYGKEEADRALLRCTFLAFALDSLLLT
jgi:hypothetical protein